MCISLKTTATIDSIGLLHAEPSKASQGSSCQPQGWVHPPARWAKEGPWRLTACLQPQRQRNNPGLQGAGTSAILLSVSPYPRLYISFVAMLGRPRPSSESVPEPVLLQGPSTSSRNTAATVTWWIICTATNTPSCSDTPTSIVRPVLSSTATPCLWGSPYPGIREAAPVNACQAYGHSLSRSPRLQVWALGQSLLRASTLTR